MYCNFCGKAIQDDALLCAYCGTRVAGADVQRRLMRPRATRKIAGVCQGFADYFGLEVTLIRIVTVILAIFAFPTAEIAYVVAWIIMPEAPEVAVVPVAAARPVTNP
jgi:phage shock protein PspC (stress-responsive transcriptional regulator)